MSVGLMLPTLGPAGVDPVRLIETARRAEALGFDGVHTGDHLLHPHPMLESLVTLAAVAASTERVTIGPCVLLLALRSPVVLAKQLGTLAAFAPGRLRVGVGVGGEYPAEFDAVGVPLAGRGRRMESVLLRVRSLLRDGAGREDGTIEPLAPDVPFVLGGWSEPALRRAAAYGDGWIGYLLAPDSFARRRELLLRLRDDRPFCTGMLLPVHVGGPGEDAAAGWARLTGTGVRFPRRLFVGGGPDQVVDGLLRYAEAGATDLVLAPVGQGPAHRDQVEALARDVLPALRAAGL